MDKEMSLKEFCEKYLKGEIVITAKMPLQSDSVENDTLIGSKVTEPSEDKCEDKIECEVKIERKDKIKCEDKIEEVDGRRTVTTYYPGTNKVHTISTYIKCSNSNYVLNSFGDKESKITYDTNGMIEELAWHFRGMLHRANKPALIKFMGDGITVETWYDGDNIHREINKGAAIITREGRKEVKLSYYLKGKLQAEYDLA